MSELKGKARDLKEVYHDLQTQSFLLGTAFTEIVKTGINFLWKDLIGGIHSFISEGIEMAQSADGITKAFEGLNQPGLLDNLRFLDMQYRRRNDRIAKFKRRNLALYNRVVWGVLFHETFPDLRTGSSSIVVRRG